MKDRRFELRLSEKEYQKLVSLAALEPDCQAKRSGKPSLSAYVRKQILRSGDQPVDLVEELKPLSYQIRKAGININQVARRVNAGLWDGRELNEILACQQRMEELLDEILCLVREQQGQEEKEGKTDGDHQDEAYQRVRRE